ncbi:MAG: helix-turn-helix transcriptional regulator [Pseudomonadota bacterium]
MDDMVNDIDAETYYHEDTATFGDRVAAAREAAGLTQAKLARRLGVKKTTIENWEADRSEPRANRLQMLAGILNVSIIWLMSGHGDGVDLAPEGDVDGDDLRDVLAEVTALRAEYVRMTERLARLEKRLRGIVG